MTVCTEEERQAGRAYPRTCPTCKLSPCQRGHHKGTTPPAPMTTPKAESEAALIARLNKAEADDRCNDTLCYEAADVIAALLDRAEAAEADAASEREVSRENFNQLFLARKELTTAQASIGAAWCEGRDAMMPTVKANCRICGGSGYSGGSGGTGKAMTVMYPCGHGVARLTPPPDAAAALQRAKDEAWNAAVEAILQGVEHVRSSRKGQQEAETNPMRKERFRVAAQQCGYLLDDIRALRKEG